jgi:fused signal recognition particle receptor
MSLDNVLPIVIGLIVAGLLLWLLVRRRSIELPSDTQSTPPTTGRLSDEAKRRELAAKADVSRHGESAAAAPSVGTERAVTPEQRAERVSAEELELASEPAPQPSAAEAAAADRLAQEATEASAKEHDVDVLRRGLANTRGGFIARLAKLFGSRPTIDEALLEQVEEVLITADLGVKTSERMLGRLREQMQSGALKDADAVWASLREMASEVLDVAAKPIELKNKPSLLLVIGVNGAGKTTTIGKLAARYTAEGRRVLLAAGDTYRAAAVLQLEVWGRRVNCPVIKGKEGADPSGVIFDAVKRAQDEGYDLVIADTAGRLHTKAPLMEELKKVERTIHKALGGRGADEILLVLDATTGQNAVQQMHMFREALQVSGVVLTKLDGTAKGGMILGIVDEQKVPVRFVGLGERVEDLREFDPKSFVEALFSKPDGETLAA